MPLLRTSPAPDLIGHVQGTINRMNSEADRASGRSGTRLAQAAQRLFGGGKMSPLDEMRTDKMAADVAHTTLLARKVQAELDREQAADRMRADPAAQTQYAADVAGMDATTGTQTYKALRGVRERPLIEVDDEGNPMPDVSFAIPAGLKPGQRERFQQAMAALQGSRLATGSTNAEQLAQAGSHLLRQDLMSQAANAPDVETGNRLAAAAMGHLRAPFRTDAHGITTNTETGARDESGPFARSSLALSEARTGAERAQAGERAAHAGLYRAQTDKTRKEASGAEDGLPAQQFKALTGAKLSELAPEVRLQWIQNHASGMAPAENLAALRQTARRDALMNEARQAYESSYPKTIMGQRAPGAPDFLTFADDYVAQKEGGARVPKPGAKGNEVRGRIGGPAAGSQQTARPRTQADYDALPRGALFVDPDDGKTYRKP